MISWKRYNIKELFGDSNQPCSIFSLEGIGLSVLIQLPVHEGVERGMGEWDIGHWESRDWTIVIGHWGNRWSGGVGTGHWTLGKLGGAVDQLNRGMVDLGNWGNGGIVYWSLVFALILLIYRFNPN